MPYNLCACVLNTPACLIRDRVYQTKERIKQIINKKSNEARIEGLRDTRYGHKIPKQSNIIKNYLRHREMNLDADGKT